MSVATSKVRIYDLAKELKIDTKRLIEEVRREGVDVSVPSNSVSKELAEKIREKYFPKQAAVAKRAIKVVKKAQRPVVEEAPLAEEMAEAPVEAEAALPEAAPVEEPLAPAKPQVSVWLRNLAPAGASENLNEPLCPHPKFQELKPEPGRPDPS